jgi:NhaP-type Na+/H+ or K+/H+ antiporter
VAIEYLQDLTGLSLLLIVGLLISFLALKLRIPEVLLLIIGGALFSPFLNLPGSFLTSLSIFALIVIVFDSVSGFNINEIKRISPKAFKLTFIYFIANLIFLTFFTHLFFGGEFTINNVLMSLIFAGLMSGTDPSVALTMLKDMKNKVVDIVKVESIINTPLNVIIPLIILDVYKGIFEANVVLQSFLQNVMAGVGTGIVIGLIVFGLMRKRYSESLSPIVIVAAALISYSLAENIGGSGILSVTALGVIYSISELREKRSLGKFTNVFASFLKIIVFMLLGFIIRVPVDPIFLLKTIALFVIYLIIRHLVVQISFPDFKIGEKLFMTFNISKGVASAVVVFILGSLNLPGLEWVIHVSFAFIIYSILVETIASRFSEKMLENDNT